MFDRILLVKYCNNANRYTHIQTCVYNITISRTSRTKWIIQPFFFPLLLMSGLEFTVLAAA